MGQIITNKIHDINALLLQVEQWRADHKCIVFTNGCFDLLHKGHIALLAQARAFGDKLIVGINSDRSVRRLKGSNRPIADEVSRAWVMAAIGLVDAVIVFDTDTPLSIIQAIKPNILVKGGDYKKNNIIGSTFTIKNGGQVRVIPLISNYSTTSLIGGLARGGSEDKK